ncbi:hypothetical protein HDV01_005976 [Terramyces sp. JEL0728]|nr:hypothetical protein HDV01_005976 [Terramyces sp. JEL0728]
MSAEKIKEIIFYAREEMQITFDIAARLVASQLLSPSELEKSEEAYLKTCVGAKSVQMSNVVKLQKAQYIESIKNQRKDESSRMLETAQKFFMELAFELLKRNWVLQERIWSPIKGILFVIYGFVNDGSVIPEIGEADIWRLTLSSDKSKEDGFDVICNHNTLLVTAITIVPLEHEYGLDWGRPLVESDSFSVIKRLQGARNSIFEKDLFHKIMQEVSGNDSMFRKCVITTKKIIIPTIENCYIQVSLENAAEDINSKLSKPSQFSYVQILARKLLRESHTQRLNDKSTKKRPWNITTKIIKYLDKQLLSAKLNETFAEFEGILSKICQTQLSRSSDKWKIQLSFTGSDVFYFGCSLSDSGQLYYTSSQTHKLELFSVLYLEELVASLVSKRIFELLKEEVCCLFGYDVGGENNTVEIDNRY